ncbi:MAG: 6-bladed beta-propeller [Bacteroidales bacterium]
MKESKWIYLAISGFILLSALSCKKESSLKEYLIADITASAQEISVNDLDAQIEHIKLETTAKSLVADIMDLAMTNEYIFILSSTPRVLQFTKDGKFIREISMQGNGPGEYKYAFSIFVNEQHKSLYINEMYGKILEFDFNGSYIGEHKKTASMSKFILLPNNNLLESIHVMMGNEPTKLQVVTLNGDTLARFSNHIKFKFIPGSSGLSYGHYKPMFYFADKIVYHQISTDTVFTYDPVSGKLDPRYYFKNNGGPNAEDYANFMNKKNDLTLIYDISEDSSFIYATIITPGWKKNLYMIDKESGKYYLLKLVISNDSEQIFSPKWQYNNILIDYVNNGNTNPELLILKVTGLSK